MMKSESANVRKPLFGGGEGHLLPTARTQCLTDTPSDFYPRGNFIEKVAVALGSAIWE